MGSTGSNRSKGSSRSSRGEDASESTWRLKLLEQLEQF